MCGKYLVAIVIIIAVLLAVLASVLSPEHIDYVIVVSRFFDIMLPVLAVGALIKYLLCCPAKCGCAKCASACDKGSDKPGCH